MNILKLLGCVWLVLASAGTARAWPACSGNWVQVPSGTSSANGAVVTEGGQTFQCQPALAGSTASATAKSASSASSSASSNSQSTGGNASVGPISNTATGGAGGTATAANNSSGNSTSISEDVKIPHQTPMAYAPDGYPTVQCFKPIGVGGSTGWVSGSFGGGRIDVNCAILEAARKARNRLTYCKIYITQKYVKQAGVTFEDCMQVDEAPTPAITAPTPAPAPIIVTPQITVQPALDVLFFPAAYIPPVYPPLPPEPVKVKKTRAKNPLACPPCPAVKRSAP